MSDVGHLRVTDGPDYDIYCNGERMSDHDAWDRGVTTRTRLNGYEVRATVTYDGQESATLGVTCVDPSTKEPTETAELERLNDVERPTFRGETVAADLLIELVAVSESGHRGDGIETDGGEVEPVPLYRRDEAPVNRDTDLILILADQKAATYQRIREQLEKIDFEAFQFELRVPTGEPVPADLEPDAQPAMREPFATLWFLETLRYIPEFYPPIDVEKPIETTEKGHAAAETLHVGLTDEQATAIEEVTVL